MSHDHDCGHHHTPATFDRAFVVGIGLNSAFVAIEAYFGWQVNSLALLADAAHNLSDVAGLALAWGGSVAGRFRPDSRHTFGWKRASILAAFANATILLLAMGSLTREAIGRLNSPAPQQGVTIMAVAAIGIVVNTLTAIMFMRGRKADLNIRGAFLHMAADAVVSLGVVLAGLATLKFGWLWIDPVVSLCIVAVVVIGTWDLFWHSLHLLFDGVPNHIDPNAVRHFLESLPGVEKIHDLHIWAIGTSETALTAHLVIPSSYPDDAFFEHAERELHERFEITHVTIQVMKEPSMMQSCCESEGGRMKAEG